jgi:HSP90 family molecular chaperone
VANSLYSEKEVFCRELISNAVDASEKLRHAHLVDSEKLVTDGIEAAEIHLTVDKEAKTFVIQDFGNSSLLQPWRVPASF